MCLNLNRGAPQQMSANHGNTPAAWTAVTIGLAAFFVGGIGLMADSMTVFWIGIALMPIAIIVGVVMSRMGYGAAAE
jgi:hypothetical protein